MGLGVACGISAIGDFLGVCFGWEGVVRGCAAPAGNLDCEMNGGCLWLWDLAGVVRVAI